MIETPAQPAKGDKRAGGAVRPVPQGLPGAGARMETPEMP